MRVTVTADDMTIDIADGRGEPAIDISYGVGEDTTVGTWMGWSAKHKWVSRRFDVYPSWGCSTYRLSGQ